MAEFSSSQEINLLDTLQVLRRRRWVLISFFVICSLTVALATFLMTPLYMAKTRIMIEAENTNVLNASESSADVSNYNIFENYIETQIAFIKSDRIAGRVYDEFKLADMPRYHKKEGLAKIFQKKFLNDVVLERLRDTRMIEVSVYNPDAKLSADIANRLAEVYVQENLSRRALTFIRNQRMASLNAEFLRLQSKFDSLSNIYGPKHPDMIALKEEIRLMAQRIQNERFGKPDETDKSKRPNAEEQALLEDTLLKIQENSVLSSSRMSNIGIVDKAIVPREIAKPKHVLNVILGILLGLVGGVLLAFLVDYLDDTVKTDDDLKKNTGGVIFLGSLLSEPGSKTSASSQKNKDRLVYEHPDSASAEAYRLLRTRVLWSMSKENPPKDFAVLSSMPGEGKTTVASNFAITLTQLKPTTLLVDADMRRGRLHEAYGLDNDKGLGQYLTENLSLDAVIRKTEIPGLSVVTCGRSVIDSSRLFSSDKMDEFIQKTRARFDAVIFDTPPLTVISDASILAAKLTGALLVTRSSLTRTQVLHKALSMIKESGIHLLGVVFNDSSSGDNLSYSKYYNDYRKK